MKAISSLILALACPLACVAGTPGLDSDCFESRSMLFAGGDGLSKFYRIPALATLPDGTIVAVADRRLDSNADLPNRIDIVCRTSSDGGLTWGETSEVAVHDDGGGYGDPALGVNRRGELVCVMTHGNGLWESEPGDHAYIYTSTSKDGGRTWSTPVNVTSGLFSQTPGAAPVQCVTAFATSGRILTALDGSMWFALVTRPSEKKWSELSVYACKSTDGGKSWKALPVAVDEDADESKLLELPDGELLMSIRNRRKGWRKFARSTDKGKTWSAPKHSTTLPDPAINGDIIALKDGTLLHSICDSHDTRTKVSLFASTDKADTWSKVAEICRISSCYTSLTMIDDSHLGILSEEASSLGGLRLWFTRVDLDRLFENQSPK